MQAERLVAGGVKTGNSLSRLGPREQVVWEGCPQPDGLRGGEVIKRGGEASYKYKPSDEQMDAVRRNKRIKNPPKFSERQVAEMCLWHGEVSLP